MTDISRERMGTDDETLIRTSMLERDHAKAEAARYADVIYAAFYRMKQKHGTAETARRTGTTKSNVEYFALKGKALQ